MKKTLIIAALFAVTSGVFAQTSVHLELKHLLGNDAFQLNQAAQNDMGNDFNVTRLEYYISEIEIIHDGGKRTKATDVYLMVNAGKPGTFDLGSYDVTSIEGIRFSIGVDPSVNNDDPSKWPSGHPLAPKAPSMHWGWTSGYRFVALEGKSGSNFAQDFEVHALGNNNYFTLEIPTTAKSDNGNLIITLNADYTKAISGIDLSSGVITHGDYAEAVTLLKNFNVKVFSALDGSTNVLGVNDFKNYGSIVMEPNPTRGSLTLSGKEGIDNVLVRVVDLTGKTVLEREWNSEKLSLNLTSSGIYFVQCVAKDQVFEVRKVIVQ